MPDLIKNTPVLYVDRSDLGEDYFGKTRDYQVIMHKNPIELFNEVTQGLWPHASVVIYTDTVPNTLLKSM